MKGDVHLGEEKVDMDNKEGEMLCSIAQYIHNTLSSCLTVVLWMIDSTFLFHPADGGLLGFPTQRDIFGRSSAKGCLDHRFQRAYTASQLLALHQHRANNQYKGYG